jgi:hypothetical protein
MNRIFALLSLSFATSTAFAAGFQAELHCRSADAPIDAGYELLVESGTSHSARLTLGRITIAGSQDLGSFAVRRTDRFMTRTYQGNDIRLEVIVDQLPGVTEDEGHSATLTADIEGRRIEEKMVCKPVRRAFGSLGRTGGVTCMAHWSGWEYDLSFGQCVQVGRSGCANPFRFKSRQSCEDAYFTQLH